MRKTKQNTENTLVDDQQPTKEEYYTWYDSEIAETVLFIDEQLPGGEGLDYIVKKTKEFADMIKSGSINKVKRIWKQSRN